MFNVCPSCGQYSEDKQIDPQGPSAICPYCGHRHQFLMVPLFVVTGASGAGKSTVCLRLPGHLSECVVLESDILWCPAFAEPRENYRTYRNLWLRVVKNIGQSGRPVVLCGSAVPSQFASCPERRYLGAVHTLALVCEDAELARRLRDRPAWRASADQETVDRMLAFNRWLSENAPHTEPPMTVLDTTYLSVEETTRRTAAWVRHLLPARLHGRGT